nr:MAG TPA: hypothetical protein [Inoviridae sp.]
MDVSLHARCFCPLSWVRLPGRNLVQVSRRGWMRL